jgi:hypothetical protein
MAITKVEDISLAKAVSVEGSNGSQESPPRNVRSTRSTDVAYVAQATHWRADEGIDHVRLVESAGLSLPRALILRTASGYNY